MEWIILEALVVLALGLAIVWWTVAPGRRRPRKDASDPPRRDDRQ
jgi:hypothetical protein